MIRLDTAIAPAEERAADAFPHRSVPAVAPVAAGADAGRSGGGAALGESGEQAETARPAGVHVDLSSIGKAMASHTVRRQARRNDDIDQTDLPDEIKTLLKRVREIREQLQQKQAELREAMNDTRMRPEQRKMRVAMLQSEIMALSAALILTSNALSRLMSDLKGARRLTDEQAMLAGQLMMA